MVVSCLKQRHGYRSCCARPKVLGRKHGWWNRITCRGIEASKDVDGFNHLVGGFNHLEENISQCEGLSHIWKIKNLWNHQPDYDYYPLVNVYITMENHHLYGKINYKWQFSIAMLVYQRVNLGEWSNGMWVRFDGWNYSHKWRISNISKQFELTSGLILALGWQAAWTRAHRHRTHSHSPYFAATNLGNRFDLVCHHAGNLGHTRDKCLG